MEKIIIVFTAVLSILSFVISYFQFKEKGFLFNNSYIWASAKEREAMNKKPYYRQSAIVFFQISILFLLLSVEMIAKTGWLNYVVFGIAVLLIVYAIISSVTIGKNK